MYIPLTKMHTFSISNRSFLLHYTVPFDIKFSLYSATEDIYYLYPLFIMTRPAEARLCTYLKLFGTGTPRHLYRRCPRPDTQYPMVEIYCTRKRSWKRALIIEIIVKLVTVFDQDKLLKNHKFVGKNFHKL